MGGELKGLCMLEGMSRSFPGRLGSGAVRNNMPFVCTDVSFPDHLFRTHKPQFAEDESLKNDRMLTGLATTLISKCMRMNIKTSNYISIKMFLKTIKTSHWFRLQGPRRFFVNSWFTSLFLTPMSVGTLSSLPACAQGGLPRAEEGGQTEVVKRTEALFPESSTRKTLHGIVILIKYQIPQY